MAMAQQKPILISGAGLASLLLAQRLRRAAIPFVLFERDADVSFRGQGYRLRLSDHGLDAIESVFGGPDSPDWRRFWDACGKTGGAGFATVNARTGENIEQPGGGPGGPGGPPSAGGAGGAGNLGSRDGKIVGIARGEMRRLFLEGCEAHVRWAHHVKGYELTPGGGGVRAVFADGTTSDEGAMLIAGEGIRSEVARQLSGGRLKVYDTGARGIHGQAPAPAFRGLGEGVFRLVDEPPAPEADGGDGEGQNQKQKKKNGIFAITNVRPGELDDPGVHFGWTMGGAPGVVRAPNDDYATVGRAAADIARELTRGWHPRVRPLFDDMVDAEAAFWKITCSTPTGVPEWPNEPRVTVIGDAAHSMTPAGGIGANTAVRDAALLGRLIAEALGGGGGEEGVEGMGTGMQPSVEGVTAAYEREMRVYASEAVRTSYGMAKSQFGIEIDESSPTV